MQGTLNEIDIRSILQLIELGQRTGELLIEAYQTSLGNQGDDHPSSNFGSSQPLTIEASRIFWLVFFVNGQIVYTIHSKNRGCRRLQDYLSRYQMQVVPEELESLERITHNDIEYVYLWQLIEQHRLTPEQGKTIIQQMVKETLFDLLSLRQGAFIFEMGLGLDPLLTSLEIGPLVMEMMKEVQQWKQLHPYFQSPQQALIIADQQQLKETLPQKAYEQLVHWADGKTSLRRLSRRLQRNLGTLARGIYPYVERGWLHPIIITSPSVSISKNLWDEPTTRHRPHIVCLDDDLTIGKTVEAILTKNHYHTSLITDPLSGLSHLFELNPDVILCDIAMPKLDGYEICAMLRHSKAFQYIPIIMLTGKEGFIDRIRARMMGATDYLTKPFGEQELLLLIEKYVAPTTRSHRTRR
ncbi:response regulator [Crocosphaera subtropica ATCC 51142]|uniref:Protein PatA n=1 Tax=Crocosphaera subtropica (strain ATCC 51142 / BH68) TaxID=43989 RepID=B1WNF7_CROS5|nr:response regulator [Crocosphaera subtropica]ACB49799.1 response regulator [Crocosphaera subtropica ATCC 51142]